MGFEFMSSDDTPNERMGHFDNDFFISRVFPTISYIVYYLLRHLKTCFFYKPAVCAGVTAEA